MKKLMWFVMVVALVVVAIETFRRSPAFPAPSSAFLTGALQLLFPIH
ncbi:hypothetical protein [Alicyclobacillus mengziensis]|uniref:Uncharacterized protein n=1 Tax=Alicyclobacillus mengziensis TaxID=2931921 RepID=A0A9X7Z813_9BACL|nr:hypothetical protein [Alicyclobacillus mengziensis]QSO49097.1 hypothetical protein JZ786_09295 [Alicyclobacillus mengziensis]